MAAARRSRGPAAPELLEKVRKETQGGAWRSGLTVLTGEDFYHLDAAQRLLLDLLVPHEASDFALTVYGEQSVDLSTVVSAVRSVGMFAEQRVVLVRDVGALEGDPRALEDFAKRPPSSSYLIVRAPKLDRRRKLHQALVKHGHVLAFESMAGSDPARLARDVASMAQRKGLEIDRTAAVFLAEACAGDFYRIDAELEKIRCWMGGAGKQRVGLDAAREVAAVAGLVSGWEVADAVLHRDQGQALVALRKVLDAGEEPLRLLGGLAFRARGMLKAKALLDRGVPPARAFPAARLFGDRYENMARDLRRYTLAELGRFPSLLLRADITLKSRSIEPRAVLESLVDQMTGPGPAC